MVADYLLDAFSEVAPSLRGYVVALRADWAPEVPPITVALGGLGRRFADMAEGMPEHELVCIARLVESCLGDSDAVVRDAVATGFLESYFFRRARGGLPVDASLVFFGSLARGYLSECARLQALAD